MAELFGRIILERKSQWMNRLKNYKVEINGTEQEKRIANGSSEEFEVPGGSNEIVCKVNWCSSNTFSFTVNPGKTVYLKVGSGMKYFWIVYTIFFASIVSRVMFKTKITKEVNLIFGAILIICFVYFLYYISLGRKQYLKIEEDENNIFAK